MTHNPDPPRAGFTTLPDELKVMILRFALEEPEPIFAPVCHRPQISPTFLALACTDKAMHGLAAEVYYGCNTFAVMPECSPFIRDDDHPLKCYRLTGSLYPPFKYAHLVRTLELNLRLVSHLDMWRYFQDGIEHDGPTDKIYHWNDWQVLLRPSRVQPGRSAKAPTKSRSEWQKHFSKLDTVWICVFDALMSGALVSDAMWRVHRNLQSYADIDLRTKRLGVWFEDEDEGYTAAGRSIEKLLRNMITQ